MTPEMFFLHMKVQDYEVMSILLHCPYRNNHAQTSDKRVKWIPEIGSNIK
jgi:hypothetical protein